jgi:hypothetical protein
VAERNVNVIGGPTFLTYDPNTRSVEIAGDPWRNQQVEPFCDVSSRNPAVIVCSAVDFRLVDLPGGADGVHHDSWNMIAQSPDGGTTWSSTLHPGHPLDSEPSVLSRYDFAADPIVEAGAAGLFYHAGLVADRPTGAPNPQGAIYVSTWIHLNDREDDPSPVKMIRDGVTEVFTGNAGQFRDRPHLAVGEPTGNMCSFDVDVTYYDEEGNKTVETVSQTVPATPAYLAVTTFLGQDLNTRSKIHFLRSDDCGRSWSPSIKLSEGYAINQAPQIVKFPGSPRILIFWRLGERPNQPDAIMVARSEDEGRTFSKPRVLAEICPFDQPTSATTFRTKTVPSGAADENRAYVAWAERPRDANGQCTMDDARIVMMTTKDGEEATTSERIFVDDHGARGHQIIPNVAVSAGVVHVAWMDFRNDASGIFGEYIDEAPIVTAEGGNRHTADMRATEATAQAVPVFPESQQISQYVHGIPYGETEDRQLQWNVVNARNFSRMRVVFNGDYNVVAAESLVPKDPLQPSVDGQIEWVVNGTANSPPLTPVFHRFWTDSRNMALLHDEDYDEPRDYTPPDLNRAIDESQGGVKLPPTSSLYDPSQTRSLSLCDPNATGTKNLEIYSSRSTHGFYAFAPWNNKTLLGPDDETGELVPVQRAFPIVVQNTLPPDFDENGDPRQTRFILTIAGPEPGFCPPDGEPGCVPELASFEQFSVQSDGTTLPEDPVVNESVVIRAGSAIARTVYVTSSRPRAAVRVDVVNEDTGEVRAVFLNPDPSAPPNLKKPGTDDGTRPGFDIARYEVHDLDISDVVVQDIGAPEGQAPRVADQGPEEGEGTPGWRNPGWRNPGWRNPGWRNPGWRNPGWRNPGWRNTDWENPGWRNPGWRNPGISDDTAGGSKQIRAAYTNTGNTTSTYDARVLVEGVNPSDYEYQLIVYKLYATTPDDGCDWELVGNTQVLLNLPDYNPSNVQQTTFTQQSAQPPQPPADTSFSLHPGETAYVVLVVTSSTPGEFPEDFNPGTTTFAGAPDALDTEELEALADGVPPPPPDDVVFPATLSILTTSLPYAGPDVPYDTTLEATGGTGAYGWSVSPALPGWATLDPVSGRISGTPDATDVGTTPLVVHVSDDAVPPQTGTQTLDLAVQPIVVTGTVLWNNAPITDITNAAPDFWVRENPGFLPVPTLVHYDTATGAYSVPLPTPGPGVRYSIGPLFDVAPPFNNQKGFAGDYDGWISNYDVSVGGPVFTEDIDCQQLIHLTSPADSSQDVGTYPIWESYPSPVTFAWESVPDASSYNLLIEAMVGDGWGSAVWPRVHEETIVSAPLARTIPLPANDFYRATIYAYNGTIQIGKTLVSYTNGYGGFRFQVPGPVSITTSSLPDGATVLPYESPPLEATGGTGAYAWYWSGDLPPGLDLGPNSGIISGTPTSTGTYNFLVEVRDGAIPENVATKALTIQVYDHAITGTLLWNEFPLSDETGQPATITAHDASNTIYRSARYDPTDGTYWIPVPEGIYALGAYIDAAAPFEGDHDPGDYQCLVGSVSVTPGEDFADAPIDCLRLMHITLPYDNDVALPWGYVGSHGAPVRFQWDAVPGAAAYHMVVTTWPDGGGSSVDTPINQMGITDLYYDAALADSVPGYHYEGMVYAYNGAGTYIGAITVVYDAGYGGAYKFKVP